MFAVIFKAEMNEIDGDYLEIASRMRELAIHQYGCKEFSSVTEGDREISISYWESEEQIMAWKQNIEHLEAQRLGRERWYKSYSVEVVQVIRHYDNP